jgi:hypothetical protein
VGPVLGAYLILIRRAQRIEYWLSFLDELLTGRYAKLGETFSTFLQLAIDLSKGETVKSRKSEYTLSSVVLSSLSSALKVLVREMKKHEV